MQRLSLRQLPDGTEVGLKGAYISAGLCCCWRLLLLGSRVLAGDGGIWGGGRAHTYRRVSTVKVMVLHIYLQPAGLSDVQVVYTSGSNITDENIQSVSNTTTSVCICVCGLILTEGGVDMSPNRSKWLMFWGAEPIRGVGGWGVRGRKSSDTSQQ